MEFIIIGLIMGVITAAIASSKGRSVVGWFFVGFLIGLIGLIICLCMSNLKEELARQSRQEAENRRLREQLLQERIKLETLRQYTSQRLDAHDQALEMDTRSAAALPDANQPAGYLPAEGFESAAAPAPAQSVQQAEDIWYYEHNGETLGPVSAAKIRAMLASRQLSRTNLVWSPRLPDWRNANTLPEFQGAMPL